MIKTGRLVYAHMTVIAQGDSEPNGPCNRGAAIQSLITQFNSLYAPAIK